MCDKIKSSAAFQRFQRAIEPLLSFLKKFLRDWSLFFAGMIAYYLLIAIVPMAVAVLGIIGLILKAHPDAQEKYRNQIINSFSGDKIIQNATKDVANLAIVQLMNDAGALLVISIILEMFGASRLFVAIDRCFTVIYRLPERTFLRRNLVAFGMVSIFIALFILMLAASSTPSILIDEISSRGFRAGVYMIGILSSLLVSFVLFEIIYWIVPNKKMSFKVTWCGALVAACLLEIVIILFPLYVENNSNSYTGLYGFLLLFILLLYYYSIILILGAQINAFCFEHYQPFDKGMGTCLSQIHDEHGNSDPRKPLIDENADTQSLQYQ